MQFRLTIKTGNAAFVGEQENPFGDSTNYEVARILHTLAERVEAGGVNVTSRDQDDPFVLKDANGPIVGTAYFVEEDE